MIHSYERVDTVQLVLSGVLPALQNLKLER